jgi:hypothetical protein
MLPQKTEDMKNEKGKREKGGRRGKVGKNIEEKQRRMREREQLNNEVKKKIVRKWSCPDRGIILALSGVTEEYSEEPECVCRDSNRKPQEYRYRTLPLCQPAHFESVNGRRLSIVDIGKSLGGM